MTFLFIGKTHNLRKLRYIREIVDRFLWIIGDMHQLGIGRTVIIVEPRSSQIQSQFSLLNDRCFDTKPQIEQ